MGERRSQGGSGIKIKEAGLKAKGEEKEGEREKTEVSERESPLNASIFL